MKLRINFKAVVVLLFGFFCIYSYFRLIHPYLKVGGSAKLVSATIFSRKVVEINGERYSYWTNNVTRPSKIVVMLPPSSATGDYFGKYVEIFPQDVLIVAPDYPGRGLTDRITDFDTIPLLSARVGVLLKRVLGRNSFDVVAPSFGGMIGTELAKDNSLKINKIFLIATGEFFAPDQKFMYRLIFYPARVSEKVRSRYVALLTGGNYFTNLKNSNIEDMLEQWLTTIDYKIDSSHSVNTPAIIIIFDKDNIVQPDSRLKLEQVFRNHREININTIHSSASFFNNDLMEIVKSNI